MRSIGEFFGKSIRHAAGACAFGYWQQSYSATFFMLIVLMTLEAE